MRIAILSLVPGHNYGGILQSYALQTVLERMGHDVKVISKEPDFKERGWKKYIKYGVRTVRKYILRSQTELPIKREQYYKEKRAYELQNTLKFVDKYLHLRMIDKFSDIKENEFDAFIVGSDQVWRPKYFCGQFRSKIENAFLAFTKGWNVKRIVYAASFGVDFSEYSDEQRKSCGELLKYFDFVSVREDAGVTLCRDLFGVSAVQCSDPTMLLSADDYKKLIPHNLSSPKGKLLTYCLDKSENLNVIIDKVSKEKGLIPFEINKDSNGVKPSVEAWLKAFSEAEFVVTDSFHACVFSMIFNKPFVVVGNEKRGMSRFMSLLKQFGQEKRLISCVDDLNEEIYSEQKNYNLENFSKSNLLEFSKVLK